VSWRGWEFYGIFRHSRSFRLMVANEVFPPPPPYPPPPLGITHLGSRPVCSFFLYFPDPALLSLYFFPQPKLYSSFVSAFSLSFSYLTFSNPCLSAFTYLYLSSPFLSSSFLLLFFSYFFSILLFFCLIFLFPLFSLYFNCFSSSSLSLFHSFSDVFFSS
jgi:hypothetical protein